MRLDRDHRLFLASAGRYSANVQPIILRELPGVASIEERYRLFSENRLMADEIADLERRIDELSFKLFGINEYDTTLWGGPEGAVDPDVDWESHFEFLEYQFDEEDAFWTAFNVDVSNGKGEPLLCIDAFGRQLVCALKRIHPTAALLFLKDGHTPLARRTPSACLGWPCRRLPSAGEPFERTGDRWSN